MLTAGIWFGRAVGLLGRLPLWVWPLALVLAWGATGRVELRHLRATVATEHKQQAAAIAASKAAASAVESTWKERVYEQHRANEIEVGNVSAALDAATARLRDRPARRADVPGVAASACQGATGAELSGPDGLFLSGEAARANRLRADLAECQEWVETVTSGRR